MTIKGQPINLPTQVRGYYVGTIAAIEALTGVPEESMAIGWDTDPTDGIQVGHYDGTDWHWLEGGGTGDHGALTGLTDDDHPQYIRHSLADAQNDFLLGNAAGDGFEKVDYTNTVSRLSGAFDATYAPIAKGVDNGNSHNHVGGDGAALNYTSPIGTYVNAGVPASTTYYTAPMKTTLDTSTTNVPWPEGGTLSDMTVRLSTGQSGTGSLVFTLYKNNVATSLVVTVAAGASSGSYSDTTHSEAIVAGDLLRWGVQNNATIGSATTVSITMKNTKQTI